MVDVIFGKVEMILVETGKGGDARGQRDVFDGTNSTLTRTLLAKIEAKRVCNGEGGKGSRRGRTARLRRL